jgi:Ca2+/H+ antiporter, TMEM165/GDT1 family
MVMEALWISLLTVAVAEIGDKTQLLAVLLAARFGKPVQIIAGIFVATILNHALAAWFGAAIAGWLTGMWFQVALGASFIAMGLWALIPDKDDDTAAKARGGVFLTTLVAFFLVEIGDKTQIATSLLAANFNAVLWVTIGTTLGMMVANVPAVLLGHKVLDVVPLDKVRLIAAGIFAIVGMVVLASAIGLIG